MSNVFKQLAPPSVILAVMASAYHNPLVVSVGLSALAGLATFKAIPAVSSVFVSHGRAGKDLLKKGTPTIPESMGAIAGVIYIIAMFVFIPVPFVKWFRESAFAVGAEDVGFAHDKFAQFLGGLLALMSMLFLGFADDVLDIRWRVKIWLPLIASLPLLMVYSVTYGGTDVAVPKPLRSFFEDRVVHLGGFYYAFMAALAIFSTNAINILAGVNGVEAGQSLVIALSIVINDILQIQRNPSRIEAHLTSLYFVLPFVGVTIGFLMHNWYPARAFPGDTFCYFAGMIFAVVGILGNFSKTVLLFMIPQIFNFVYSCPQLFGFVDCPRHRMPRCDAKTNLLHPTSCALVKTGSLGRLMVRILEVMRLVRVRRDPTTGAMVESNNLTLMNLILVKLGPMREDNLAMSVMGCQVICSGIAFVIRYLLVQWPKDQISRVAKMLADEYGTASNIKSRVNRLSVLSAITSTQQRLKLYPKVPTNGLVVYCGTIVTDEGKEKKVNIDFEPFKPINTSLYMCDNKFHTEALSELLESDSKFGFIVMDGHGTLFGTLAGNTREIVHKVSVDLPKKHGRGGQSALRFARLREEKRHNYVRKVSELAVQFFITNDKVNVSGLVLAGSADFKTDLSQSDLFDQRLVVKIIKLVDVSYGGENGFNQAIELCGETLSNVKFIQEKKLIQKYFDEISQDTGKICYGVDDTLKALDLGAVETLIVWEDLPFDRFVLKNSATGEEVVKHLTKEDEKNPIHFHDKESGADYETIDRMPLLEWFTEKYKDFGATLEYITNRSQEGSQFVKGFGGIGGLLRYKVDFAQLTYDSEDEYLSDD
ncbi:Polypeptide release factor (eRF1) in translation termination [Thoreauomyces humboldtii]|nr:Polypeptide release factor (eRF1) in translation termination [Thoreauomyces humboldtii]